MFNGKDIISTGDLTKKELIHILEVARKLEKRPRPNLLQGKILGNLFFEPSTRTRLSFEAAMNRLGGKVLGFTEPSSTSYGGKGESFTDTIKMAERYADALVVRHPSDGSARLAAEVSSVPVINAGDGANQHPTQTLLDLYTIKKSQGKIQKLKIGMVGDLKYGRTAHSLAKALALFNCELFFISPESLKMPKSIKNDLMAKGISYSEHKSIEGILPKLEILYATRIQKERFPDAAEYEKVKNSYILTKSQIKDVKNNFRIMHPLPRINEIDTEIDKTKYAIYFEQAANGVPVRQAILALVMGRIK